MSKRVIDNPELIGWELDPSTGRWMWAGGSGSGGGPSTHVGDTAPINPVEGQMWLNSDDGYLYVYYDNAGNPAWMAVEREGGSGGGDSGGDNNGTPHPPFQEVELLVNAEGFSDGDKQYGNWDISNAGQAISHTDGAGKIDFSESKHGDASAHNPSGYFTLGSPDVGAKSWTFEFWIKSNSFPNSLLPIAGKWTNNSTVGRAWQLNYTKGTRKLELMHSPDGSSFTRLDATFFWNFAEWVHMAVVYNAAEKRISAYANGDLAVVITNAEPIDSIDRPWQIGGIQNADSLPCHIDDIRLTVGTALYNGIRFEPPGELPTSARSLTAIPSASIREWQDDSQDSAGGNDADLS